MPHLRKSLQKLLFDGISKKSTRQKGMDFLLNCNFYSQYDFGKKLSNLWILFFDCKTATQNKSYLFFGENIVIIGETDKKILPSVVDGCIMSASSGGFWDLEKP